MALAGVAVLLLVGALTTPWWGYSFSYQGNQIHLMVYPGITFEQTCAGLNCSSYQESYTYSSTGLTQTGALMQASETALAADLFVGTGCFLAAMITWVDRARRGAVRTTMAVATLAGAISLGAPIFVSTLLPGALASDTAGMSDIQNLGPQGGWLLMFVAATLFFAAVASEWTTLPYAKPWDAPLSSEPPPPSERDPPVTAPPDRVLRVERLWKQGLISAEDFEVQRARILSPDRRVETVPIPPNAGSREAARAHIEYLRASGRYGPDQFAAQKENVLRAYGLSADFRFPEEEMQTLTVLLRAGEIGSVEFDRRKKEVLDGI